MCDQQTDGSLPERENTGPHFCSFRLSFCKFIARKPIATNSISMHFKFHTHRGFLFILFVCLSSFLKSQITYSTGYTADEIAGYLAGSGVEIDNATVDCHTLAIGYFDCVDCNVGIDSGVVLTTGRASNILGPNNSCCTGTSNGLPGDPDLDAYPGVGTTHDACALEFDIYAPGDSLKFDYVFGSDEYPEFVGSINDAFAFFITGPGFVGVNNIALIPGTALPVTIDNVNAGSYSMYYIPNGTGGVGVYATDPYYIEFDAFTTVLEAAAAVTPCEWYHLKLVVADEADWIYDSGVFLKAKSLVTNSLADYTYPGVPFGLGAFFCQTDPDPEPVFAAGAAAGIFTATPTGLVFNDTTGAIDLSASTPGTYAFTNTLIYGFCDVDTAVYTINVTITAPPVATFSYPASPFCINETDPSPTFTGGGVAGDFTFSPAGLVINDSTGVIDLSASTPGTYTITNFVTGEFVCPDATATATITIYPTYATSVLDNVCSGETYYLPDGTGVVAAGIYTTTLNTINGCDSVITTFLGFYPVYTATVSPAICEGDTYTLPDGTIVNATGSYTVILPTIHGCDSTIITDLTVSPAFDEVVNTFICDGEIYVLPDGSTTTTTGTYNTSLLTAAGCDSTITTHLMVFPVYASTVNAEICDDAIYSLPDGTTADVSGTYISNLTTTHGCDSIITTNLTVHPTYDIVLNEDICIGETYTLPDGVIQSTSGIFNYAFISVNGCDSSVTVNLTVHDLPVLSWTIDDIFCLEQGFVALEATPAGGTYSGTGVAGSDFSTALAGVGGPYTLTYDYTDMYGCSSSITVETSVDDNYASAWGDTTVYYGEDANLFSDAGGDYNWSPTDGIDCTTCPDIIVTAPYTIDYVLTSVDENGCIASDDAIITVLPDPGNILYVPNTFTPNGDNINDFFFVFGWNLIDIKSIRVFDRWGEMLYSVEDIIPGDLTKGWDGTFNGQNVNSGVYAYMVEVQFETGQIMSQAGNITLIR